MHLIQLARGKGNMTYCSSSVIRSTTKLTCCVMLVMMYLHGCCIHAGLQSLVTVGQIWQSERHAANIFRCDARRLSVQLLFVRTRSIIKFVRIRISEIWAKVVGHGNAFHVLRSITTLTSVTNGTVEIIRLNELLNYEN